MLATVFYLLFSFLFYQRRSLLAFFLCSSILFFHFVHGTLSYQAGLAIVPREVFFLGGFPDLDGIVGCFRGLNHAEWNGGYMMSLMTIWEIPSKRASSKDGSNKILVYWPVFFFGVHLSFLLARA